MPRTRAKMFDGYEYEIEGTFANGDHWTGERNEEEGRVWYQAVDKEGYPYETQEVPKSLPLFTLTQFVGSWTAAEVMDSLARMNGQEPA